MTAFTAVADDDQAQPAEMPGFARSLRRVIDAQNLGTRRLLNAPNMSAAFANTSALAKTTQFQADYAQHRMYLNQATAARVPKLAATTGLARSLQRLIDAQNLGTRRLLNGPNMSAAFANTLSAQSVMDELRDDLCAEVIAERAVAEHDNPDLPSLTFAQIDGMVDVVVRATVWLVAVQAVLNGWARVGTDPRDVTSSELLLVTLGILAAPEVAINLLNMARRKWRG